MSKPRPGAEPSPPAAGVDDWSAVDGLVHGFFGRAGGHSDAPWTSLNLSEKVGDDPAAVRRNWGEVSAAIGGLRVVRMTQVHGATVHLVEPDTVGTAPEHAGECDGMLSIEPGLVLAVMTADCVPILMVSPRHRAVMALHAGWRGTVAGIAAEGIRAARRLGIEAGAWQAALGPAIGGCCYEVGAEIGDELEQRWGPMPDAWQPAGRRGKLDLRRANTEILCRHGVPRKAIRTIGPCTACEPTHYFSHRRSAGRTGRQASLIGFRA